MGNKRNRRLLAHNINILVKTPLKECGHKSGPTATMYTGGQGHLVPLRSVDIDTLHQHRGVGKRLKILPKKMVKQRLRVGSIVLVSFIKTLSGACAHL